MFDLGIEAITRYPAIAYYGAIWSVEFRDYTTALVISDSVNPPYATDNYILEPESGEVA